MNTRRLGAMVAGLAVLALAGWYGYRTYYVEPVSALDATIGQYERLVKQREIDIDKGKGTRAKLRRFAATALGADEETVAARMRMALNEMVAHFGIEDPTVTTSRPRGVRNPASSSNSDTVTTRSTR